MKVGGSVLDDRARMRGICGEIAAAARGGNRVIVVHGGGKAITAAMNAAGLAARFVMGQRYTDNGTLEIVERVLCGPGGVNAQICEDIETGGARAKALTSLGTCVLRAQRSGAIGKDGQEVDLGRVGRVVSVDAPTLATVPARVVPVIAPVALDATRPEGKLNVNADLAAGMVAKAVAADVFVLVSDTPGIRVDEKNFAKTLSVKQIDELKSRGVIDGGMLPKVEACVMALEGKPGCRVGIVDGRVEGAAAAAIAGDQSAGTWITR